ncbi:MFS transporter [Candidatus Tisiphia endosymbiont of Nemotelus uliginosus]|uniref:MFS transporter n=1 Tax=Candidatus Tisiphia endosymbiont of Nemotelus uliginosus TaxID=3077926 RepID=UPI0035C91B14
MQEYALNNEGAITSLKRWQKEAVGLLYIGTFLEYFDLMLYVHMVVLLNELFFPQLDPHTTSIITAVSFCTTYLLRPVGALIFGYIGDQIGRKATVTITTFIMAISCLIMANLPTYKEIGISASILVIICRGLQGVASMGELIGAELYIIEITKRPAQYLLVTLISVFTVAGGATALCIASLVTSFQLNWRLAFWIGTAVAIIGIAARTSLRETPEFIKAKYQIKKELAKINRNTKLTSNLTDHIKVSKQTILSYFLISCGYPVCFYFSYIYCGTILKSTFGFNSAQVIHQSFIVSIIQLLGIFLFAFLSYRIYPLKIVKVRMIIFFILILCFPYLISHISTSFHLLVIQSSIVLVAIDIMPAVSITLKHFPIFKRFTYASILFALSRIVMHLLTFFGIVYLTKYCGHWGILIIMVPVSLGFAFGIRHFEMLESKSFSSKQYGKVIYLSDFIRNSQDI